MMEGDKIVLKPRSAFTPEETEKVAENRAMNILFCGLDSNEFNCFSACDTSKEVWDIHWILRIYKVTSQVQESKIDLYVHRHC